MTCSTTAIVESFRHLEQFAQEIPMNILKQVDYGCEKQIAIYKHHQWVQSIQIIPIIKC